MFDKIANWDKHVEAFLGRHPILEGVVYTLAFIAFCLMFAVAWIW